MTVAPATNLRMLWRITFPLKEHLTDRHQMDCLLCWASHRHCPCHYLHFRLCRHHHYHLYRRRC